MSKAEILLIEDDERLSTVLKKGLEERGYGVTQAFDGDMGLRLFENGGFDLIITDLILPKVNGLDISKSIRLKDTQIPIIMLTALGATDDKVEGFDAGADDYLVKPFDFRELHARIRTLLKRSGRVAEQAEKSIFVYADLQIDSQLKKASRAGIDLNLTPKEYSLLEYMVKNPERVLSREEIAREVWGVNFDTGTNFIDVYINYIRKKVDKPFEDKLIHTRSGMGFLLQKT
ncbi:response regulator transcription factor [Cecembia calidifontis]|jgi:DNA-binding response OmpR family regulator|uniref:DNA-binding response OmpR family regulator n=1 Tax=Cecembia calidifontis TaxID=1187080 RepID=A0A4Q7P717_9BACT|nr:response regulator transcription factor [Cecembia calidifontis]RZS95270.1 DNA-binding response OmpR family regulator [Cecembia calidifontis]